MIAYFFMKSIMNNFFKQRIKVFKYRKLEEFSIKPNPQENEIDIPIYKIEDSFILANLYYAEEFILYYFYQQVFTTENIISDKKIIVFNGDFEFLKSIVITYMKNVEDMTIIQQIEEELLILPLREKYESLETQKILKVIIGTILWFFNKNLQIDLNNYTFPEGLTGLDSCNLENIKLVSNKFLQSESAPAPALAPTKKPSMGASFAHKFALKRPHSTATAPAPAPAPTPDLALAPTLAPAAAIPKGPPPPPNTKRHLL